MKKILDKIESALKSSDITDKRVSKRNLAKIIYYRLMIARLGEEDNNFWWESLILSKTGRQNLEMFLPKTLHKQRLEIARKTVQQKEQNEIKVNRIVTLFHFGFDFERKVFEPAMKLLVERPQWLEILEEVENIIGYSAKKYWARDFFELYRLKNFEGAAGTTYELGTRTRHFYIREEELNESLEDFIAVYDLSQKGQVVIPYYKRVAVE